MNCSFCAAAGPAESTKPAPESTALAATANAKVFRNIAFSSTHRRMPDVSQVLVLVRPARRTTSRTWHWLRRMTSIGEGPQPEFFLRDRPQPRKAVRLDDQ